MNQKSMKSLAVSLLLGVAGAASAQVPVVNSPVEALESIANIQDTDALAGSGAVVRKLFAVPAARFYRVTDVTVDLRRVNSSAHPCFFEIWRGNDTQPLSLAWQRARIFTSATYDRSFVTGPQFGPGEVVWVIARMDPLATGLRTCVRDDPAITSEMRYALRGYLTK